MAISNGINYNQTQGLKISTNNITRAIVSTGGTTTFISNTSGTTVVESQGVFGQLFSVTDDLSGVLFAVNDVSGNAIMQVNSNYSTIIGTPYLNTLVVSGSNVGVGVLSPTNKFHLSASTDPIKIQGIQTATDSKYLTVDNNGVVHLRSDVLTGSLSITSVTLSNNVLSVTNSSGITTNSTIINYTGVSFTNNTLTLTNNTGGTITVLLNNFSGLTVSGVSNLNGGISSLSLTGSTDRIVQVSSGGTLSATTDIISGYISSGSTVATLLSNTSNWDIDGNYIGTAIAGTYQGQRYYDSGYLFEAVNDNNFIRLIRG